MTYKEKSKKRLEKFIERTNTCWLWTGYVSKSGYGQCFFNKKSWKAHRAIYVLYKSAIPKGKQIDHLCRVRHCVNPNHLEVVTQKENILRGFNPMAVNARKKHCPKCGENYIVRYNGSRRCLKCMRDWMRVYRATDLQEHYKDKE